MLKWKIKSEKVTSPNRRSKTEDPDSKRFGSGQGNQIQTDNRINMTQTGKSTDGELGRLVSLFLNGFGGLLQSHKLYPSDSPKVREAMNNFVGALDNYFNYRAPLAMAVIREELYIDEFKLQSRGPLAEGLVDLMLDRLVRKVVIEKGVYKDSLFVLAKIFNTSPIDLRDMGGPEIVLTEHGAASHINIIELSNLFDEQQYDPNSWQARVKKLGLDVKEVSDYVQGPGFESEVEDTGLYDSSQGLASLTRQETSKLAEVLMEPGLLSEMLCELSSSPAAPEKPRAAQVVHLSARVENILVARTNHPRSDIEKSIYGAIQEMEITFKACLIKECFNQIQKGMYPWFLKYVDLSHSALSELDNLPSVKTRFPQRLKITGNSFKYLEDKSLKMNDPGVPNSFFKLTIDQKWSRRKTDKPSKLVQSCKAAIGLKPVQSKLKLLADDLKNHVDAGYANTLLGLAGFTEKPEQLTRILDALSCQVKAFIEIKNPSGNDFLTRFAALFDLEEKENKEGFEIWIKTAGGDFVTDIINLAKQIEGQQRLGLLSILAPLASMAGKNAMAAFLDEIYFTRKRSSPQSVMEILQNHTKGAILLLEDYLNDNCEDFSPSRFLKGMDLYLHLMGGRESETVKLCLASKTDSVRQCTLLRLGTSAKAEYALPLLRKVVFSNLETDADDRILAIYGLGIHKDVTSKEDIKALAKKPPKGIGSKGREFRLAAAYAYGMLAGEDGMDQMIKIYKKATKSGLKGLLSWR